MNLKIVMRISKFLLILQVIAIVHTSHVQNAKKPILKEINGDDDDYQPSPPPQLLNILTTTPNNKSSNRRSSSSSTATATSNSIENYQNDSINRAFNVNPLMVNRRQQPISRPKYHRNRWNNRKKFGPLFTAWTAWTQCDRTCIRSRERYCKVKRRCGHTKHIEEKKCPKSACHMHYTNIFHHQLQLVTPGPILSQTLPPILPKHRHNYHRFPSLAAAASNGKDYRHHKRQKLQVYEEFSNPYDNENEANDDDGDYFVVKKQKTKRFRKKKRPILIEVDDYEDLEDEDDIDDDLIDHNNNRFKYNKKFMKSIRTKKWHRNDNNNNNNFTNYYLNMNPNSHQQQTKHPDLLQQFDWNQPYQQQRQPQQQQPQQLHEYDDQNVAASTTNNQNEYHDDDYDDVSNNNNDDDDVALDYKNYTNLWATSAEAATGTATAGETTVPRERAVYDLPPRHRRVYTKWSDWTKCSPKCTTRRYKKCRLKDLCGKEILREIAYCFTEGSFCEQWLQNQAHKTTDDIRPMFPPLTPTTTTTTTSIATSRKDTYNTNNNIQFSNTISANTNDYLMNGKGYRGREYQPMKLKCGLAPIRNNKRNMYNLLKIIGGRASRKGEWPWQVVIFNRFKEAFCGGTLIAPNWIVTAAHCVRKVLYVRLGEHNLDIEDGTEIEYRIVKSIKHPNYDKKTVDSDIALLRLPKSVNASTWIGFSCLPKPYQKLPKNIQCTVIGWGKRRNRDQAGTSLLQNAEVPIISMDNCKSVYHDYTITNNMFCAGHKRGRIDTCAGDSGGPLLCRDSTKRNHPWTIFGITSFGDGCAKRNKFGIYTKVTNYVDWIWSVINCNGNCNNNNNNKSFNNNRRYL